jgi:hypothetical protein
MDERRNKMSQVINLRRDSEANGELSNSASVPSLSLSRKRPLDKEEIPNNENGPGNKSAAEIVVDVELADGVEVVTPHHKKRGGRVKSILLRAAERGVGSEDVQVADHREAHEGIIAATPPPSVVIVAAGATAASRLQSKVSWEDRWIELADYRKVHGHCNVPKNYSENSKLASWVRTQRDQYRLQQEGKASSITTFRIQQLESLGFEWRVCLITWEDRLSELADYRKVHGHCNVLKRYSENPQLGKWVETQRSNYKLRREGKTSSMTALRIQELERLGFEWVYVSAAWENRLSELAAYHKIHGHCNVPRKYSENSKLAHWVANQRTNYRLYQEGKSSRMTTYRIQELERLGFVWRVERPFQRACRLPKDPRPLQYS